jgi:hypothetical protein
VAFGEQAAGGGQRGLAGHLDAGGVGAGGGGEGLGDEGVERGRYLVLP